MPAGANYYMIVLTVEDKILENLAIIEPTRRKIVWISGVLIREMAPKILSKNPRLREEVFDSKNKQIIMTLREIWPGDLMYAEALRQEFKRRGFSSQLVSSKAAKLQAILRRSPLPRDLQNKIIYNLKRLTDPQVEQILTELRSA